MAPAYRGFAGVYLYTAVRNRALSAIRHERVVTHVEVLVDSAFRDRRRARDGES